MGAHDILEYRFQRSIWTVRIVVIDLHIRISSLNSGGSLDMYGIVPEIVLGRITVAVSPVFFYFTAVRVVNTSNSDTQGPSLSLESKNNASRHE